jgi:hypothetical protein
VLLVAHRPGAVASADRTVELRAAVTTSLPGEAAEGDGAA